MSAINALVEHRTKLVGMKAMILATRRDNANIHACSLDRAITACDKLIEISLTTDSNDEASK